MFDEVIRELRQFDGTNRISIDMPLDKKGYLDRQCPAENCQISFKVHDDDWNSKLSKETAYCPICGKSEADTEWNTPDQLVYAQREIERYVTGRLNKAMRSGARRFNSRGQGGFIQMRMSVTADRLPLSLPIEAAEKLRQDFLCGECGCRYSTIGAAYFCPACRRNCPLADFESSMGTIAHTLNALAEIRTVVGRKTDDDAAQNVERQLLENAVEDIATILQRTSGSLFANLPNEASFRRDGNLFQRLQDASNLWKQASGTGYEDILNAAEWTAATRMMQRRHKIGHNQGMVDENYVIRAGDSTYEAGQRLVIQEPEVREFLGIVGKLVARLRTLV